MTMNDDTLEGLLDRIVAEFADARARGEDPDLDAALAQVPMERRETLRRCLELIEERPTSSAPVPLQAGDRLGGFELHSMLGQGGMATVWRAQDPELRREVALKVLRPGLAADPRHRERFLREGRAIARLDHPNLVRVHAVAEDRGHLFLAMEYIAGQSLASVLSRLPLDRDPTPEDLAELIPGLRPEGRSIERVLAELFAQAARGLAFAHEKGIVHRDVKPSNLMIHPDGRCVVTDFGLALQDDAPEISLTGELIGTPYYMSPEQVDRHRCAVDLRTDLYSLGVSFYEALSGQRPFRGDSAVQVFDAIRRETPPILSELRSGISGQAEAVVAQAMRREPGERYADANAFAEDLEALAKGIDPEAWSSHGGFFSELRRGMAVIRQGGTEYRSPRTVRGLPLVHIRSGARRPGEPLRHARGWFAVGDTASGFVAIGAVRASGFFCLSGVLAVGVVPLAGVCSLGVLAMAGTLALGTVALGGAAVGVVATGGIAAGIYVKGGLAKGVHVLGAKGLGALLPGFMTGGIR